MLCRLICAYRIAWYINFSAGSVAIECFPTAPSSCTCSWRSCRLTIYASQRAAPTECTKSNRSNAIRNCYTCQRATTFECKIFNRSNSIANCNTSQRGAIRECATSNLGNSIRNCNTCQRGATIECITSNRSNAIRNCYSCQRSATRVFTTDYYSIFYR